MNLEVCNNCRGQEVKWVVKSRGYICPLVIISYKDDEATSGISYCLNRIEGKHDEKSASFDDIVLKYKTCPYYLEHCLLDWNKK